MYNRLLSLLLKSNRYLQFLDKMVKRITNKLAVPTSTYMVETESKVVSAGS